MSKQLTDAERIKQAKVHDLVLKYPDKKNDILDKMGLNYSDYSSDIYELYVTEFDSIAEVQRLNVSVELEDKRRQAKLSDEPGFSQSTDISDIGILELFESRDNAFRMSEAIKPPPPGIYEEHVEVANRIDELKPLYETLKAEEDKGLYGEGWGQLIPDLGTVGKPTLGLLSQLVAGWTDANPYQPFKENLHERGLFTSWNPLYGFGAWDMAEFQGNPRTGGTGYSRELLGRENEIDSLMSIMDEFQGEEISKGWHDKIKYHKEATDIQATINSLDVIDPRTLESE